MSGLAAQLLNGVQYGLLLFLIASGLTLIFGVMGVINLAHGSLFMIGAYVAYLVVRDTGSLWLALPAAIVGGVVLGALLERVLFRRFYDRPHLDQVLLTFALILLFEEGRSALLGNEFHSVPVPAVLDVSVPIVGGFAYSAYRLAVLAACSGDRQAPGDAAGGVTAPAPARPNVAAPPVATVVPAPEKGRPLPAPATKRSWPEVRRQAAERLVAANPDITYTGRVPDQLLAIPVLEIELNRDGSVRKVEILREPREAKDTLKIAVAAVQRAAPFGDVSHLPRPWKFVETFLFDENRKFKPRTLD